METDDDIRDSLLASNQGHLLKFVSSLNEDERDSLVKQIKGINWSTFPRIVEKALTLSPSQVLSNFKPLPPSALGGRSYTSSTEVDQHHATGLKAVAECKVGVVLLAGGQATRLGVKYPKGLYNVGLPSGKSLYQLHAERIRKVELLAAKQCPGTSPRVVWYIMTSEATQIQTAEFFASNSYFGLHPDNVFFFEQFTFPCVAFDGKILLAGKHKLQASPDGNGGLYRALKERGVLRDMAERGLRFLHIFGVDNILTRAADPDFLGFCIDKEVEMGAKIVEKTNPKEKVGVVTLIDGKYQVVEYSEISDASATAKDPLNPGKLLLRAGNICQHFITADCLDRVCSSEVEAQLVYHVAKKKIPFFDDITGTFVEPEIENGIKLEKFVFDIFPFAGPKFAAWEVPRCEEFSPLKNGPGSAADNPDTCLQDLLQLHADWLKRAGFVDVEAAEISPLVSYAGEGLEGLEPTLCSDKIYRL